MVAVLRRYGWLTLHRYIATLPGITTKPTGPLLMPTKRPTRQPFLKSLTLLALALVFLPTAWAEAVRGTLMLGGGTDDMFVVVRTDDGRRIRAYCGSCGPWFVPGEGESQQLKDTFRGKNVVLSYSTTANKGRIAGAGDEEKLNFIKSLVFSETQAARRSCREAVGEQKAAALVKQCTSVSPATRPPCNAANQCELIEGEIERGCARLSAESRPRFCNSRKAGS